MKNKFLLILGTILLSSTFTSCTNHPDISNSTSENNMTNINEITGISLENKELNLVKWEGRYAYKKELGMMMLYHTATGFTVDFYGTELKAAFYHDEDLNGTPSKDIYYDVKLDDETLPNINNRRIKLPKNDIESNITLVKDLENGHHTVTVLKMNEGNDSFTGIKKIQTDGYFLKRDEPKDNKKPKILAINASYGSGYGSLAYSEVSGTEFKKTTSNSSSLHAFQYLTARRLDADIQFVATSGWGITYPASRSISKIIDNVGVTPTNNVEGSNQTGTWNKDNYVPDIISFHIGGNDEDSSQFNEEGYKTGVLELVNKLHTYYPNAKMLWNHTNSKAGKFAIEAIKEAGIIQQGYLKQCIIPGIGKGDTGNGTYGASNHASLKTQIDASEAITSNLSRWGFTPVREQINFLDYVYLLEK